jgi:hypothetical protein
MELFSGRNLLSLIPALLYRSNFFMKVTLNWFKQYVDFNWSPQELALKDSKQLTNSNLGVF